MLTTTSTSCRSSSWISPVSLFRYAAVCSALFLTVLTIENASSPMDVTNVTPMMIVTSSSLIERCPFLFFCFIPIPLHPA